MIYRRYERAADKNGYVVAEQVVHPDSASATNHPSDYRHRKRRHVVVVYPHNCVPHDNEFWLEVRILLDFVTAIRNEEWVSIPPCAGHE